MSAAPLTITSFDLDGAGFTAAPADPPPPELAHRLLESFADPWAFGWPQQWRAHQDFAFGGYGAFPNAASGTVNDRRGGRNLPLFWSEIDLRGFRVLSRYLADTNDFAIGFLSLLKGFNVRKGFGWQACLKGAKKTPYATNAQPTDPLVAKAQRILDTFRDDNLWPVTSREAFLRWRRDGEVFGRLFRRGWGALPAFRFIEPEQIGAPDGDTNSPWAFGIDVKELSDGSLDPGHVLAYHVWRVEDGGVTGDWVDAADVVHAKANVDMVVKRGLPDLFPLQDQLDGVRKLLRNMLYTAVDQAAVAWRESFPTATGEQVRAMVPHQVTGPGQTVPANQFPGWNGAPGFGYPWGTGPVPGTGNKFRPGTVIRTEGNRQFEPGPTSQGVPSYIQVVQAALRGCCVRWNLPEYATGDASNNNFASALVSGSPFTVTVEGSQLEWGACFERPVALRVLDRAVDAGLLTAEERARLDVETTEPAVVTPEPEKDTSRRNTLHQAGVLSVTTWQQQEGLDPQHEAENTAAEAKRQQAAKPQPAAGGTPPDKPPAGGDADDGGGGGNPLSGLFGESVFSEAQRVARKDGDKWQVGGNWYTKRSGKIVKTGDPNKQKGPSKKDQAARAKATKADAAGKASAAAAKLAKGGAGLTTEDVKHLDDHFVTLTADRMKEVARAIGQKVGGTKAELAAALVAHAKKLAAGPQSAHGSHPARRSATPGQPAAQKPDGTPARPVVASPLADAKKFVAANLPPASKDPMARAPSAVLPESTRPAFDAAEADAVRQYSGAKYWDLNRNLRGGGKKWKPPELAGLHGNLQKAFGKSPVLAEPVTVYRGVDLDGIGEPARAAMLQGLVKAAKDGGTITMPGYTSTTTNAGDGYVNNSDMVMTIKARHGLDVKPYAEAPNEQEMLLNHGSRFKVVGYKVVGGRHHVELEQVV